ncbi:MAG: membrane protein insertase YidC [Deltaproteobacteria bacterium]|nr:MAG: membrane protein insertase YidC [Deltaproteobacteria bacterium]
MGSDQKNAFAAIILSGLILFGWQTYFAPQPVAERPVTQVTKSAEAVAAKVETPTLVKDDFVKETIVISSGENQFAVRNDLAVGKGKTPDEKYGFHKITGSDFPFKIQILGANNTYQTLKLKITSKERRKLSAVVEELKISVSMFFQENGEMSLSLNSPMPYKYRLVFNSEKEELENRRYREFIYLTGGDVERETVGDEFQAEGKVKWVGIDHEFHIFNFIFSEKTLTNLKADNKGNLFVEIINPTNAFSGKLVFTIKNYDKLDALGDNLKLTVDFGIFGIVAVPIFRGMQFFYSWIPNYGWAIILLTLLIRTLTFPLQYKSFKSMKKMQVIQPEITKIKEKYKDDPQRMQKETMELFKRAGANPLGGCLPLLLQMPIFFAFYKVLYQSVELVGAPWIFWVTDLSQKDPLYILPVLMAISMFLQQKFTPTTTTDPMQKKLMMFMPLIFGFIMKDLPSGLTLYIFVSTIFGILQQMFVYRTTD